MPRLRAWWGCAGLVTGVPVSGGSAESNECIFMSSEFTAAVFEKDYSLLKQAVGEELGGVRDNESAG